MVDIPTIAAPPTYPNVWSANATSKEPELRVVSPATRTPYTLFDNRTMMPPSYDSRGHKAPDISSTPAGRKRFDFLA